MIIKDYLSFYTVALKSNFNTVYIDAFAGSGKTVLPSGEELEGSALIALSYDFDEYYFIELNENKIFMLKEEINNRYPQKMQKVHIIQGDCNEKIKGVLKSLTSNQRGIMFLDPYSLELDWEVLELARNTAKLDIWYLFPLSALNRNLPKRVKLPDSTKNLINRILGTDEWIKTLYKESLQQSFFDDDLLERVNFNELIDFVRNRLKKNFPYVSQNSVFLKNKNNSSLFILFFIMTNPSQKAIQLGRKVANQIFNKVKVRQRGTNEMS